MSTAVIDYGAGNIRSVENAMKALGQKTCLTSSASDILAADHVILPGVGAFGDAMACIRRKGLEEVIRTVCDSGVPFLGICLGLRILFEESEESPGVKGLSILKGRIVRFPAKQPDSFRRDNGSPDAFLKVPEIGWNALTYAEQAPGNLDSDASENRPGRLFQGIPEDTYVYFVHSYYLHAEEPEIVKAVTDYSTTIHASVEKGNVFACQFHPEKSSRYGLKILENFAKLEKEGN